MALGLIIGVAHFATDDPYGNPVKSTQTRIGQHQSLKGSMARQPGRSSGTLDRADLRVERNRQVSFKRSGRQSVTAKRVRLHHSHSGPGAIERLVLTSPSQLREVTAYNVGDPSQNYGDPCESANGENICAALDSGSKRCAANFVPFGTILRIAHYGVCTVTDRMNKRYSDRVDIAMKKDEKKKALRFGLRRLQVTVVTTRDG